MCFQDDLCRALLLPAERPESWKADNVAFSCCFCCFPLEIHLESSGKYRFGPCSRKPYTLEAALRGTSGGVLVSVLLWAGCYNAVMTSDKFTMLFGNLAPALSLLLVMVLRLIPSYFRKMRQITGSRESIGGGRTDTYAHRLTGRGYGAVRHDLLSFGVRGNNGGFHAWPGLEPQSGRISSTGAYGLGTGRCCFLNLSCFWAWPRPWPVAAPPPFYPGSGYAPMNGWNILGFAAYVLFLLIPSVLTVQEMIQWQISRSKI